MKRFIGICLLTLLLIGLSAFTVGAQESYTILGCEGILYIANPTPSTVQFTWYQPIDPSGIGGTLYSANVPGNSVFRFSLQNNQVIVFTNPIGIMPRAFTYFSCPKPQVFVPTPTPIPTSPPPPSWVCNKYLSDLSVNIVGELLEPTNWRIFPGINTERIRTVGQGVRFVVIDGPVCQDGLAWYRGQIEPGSLIEVIGWFALYDSHGNQLARATSESIDPVNPPLVDNLNYAAVEALAHALNLRQCPRPSDEFCPSLYTIRPGTAYPVYGRNANSQWVRIYVWEQNIWGWVFLPLTHYNFDPFTLPILDISSYTGMDR